MESTPNTAKQKWTIEKLPKWCQRLLSIVAWFAVGGIIASIVIFIYGGNLSPRYYLKKDIKSFFTKVEHIRTLTNQQDPLLYTNLSNKLATFKGKLSYDEFDIITKYDHRFFNNELKDLYKVSKNVGDEYLLQYRLNQDFLFADSTSARGYFLKVQRLDNSEISKVFKKYGSFDKQFVLIPYPPYQYDKNIFEKLAEYDNKGYLEEEQLKYAIFEPLDPAQYHVIEPYFNEITELDNRDMYHYWWLALGVFLLSLIYLIVLGIISPKSVSAKKDEEKISEAIKVSQEETDKIKPTWDVAQLTLQQYFNRNIAQINIIYWASVIIMLGGFCIVIAGIILSYGKNSNVTIGVVGIVSGTLIDFIGATFLFLYRSTVKQGMRYITTLEKINNVGMSMKILDTITEDETNKTEMIKAKIEIAKLLINQKLDNG